MELNGWKKKYDYDYVIDRRLKNIYIKKRINKETKLPKPYQTTYIFNHSFSYLS